MNDTPQEKLKMMNGSNMCGKASATVAKFAMAVVAMAAAGAFAAETHSRTIDVEDGEYWWGAHVDRGSRMPYADGYSNTLIGNNIHSQCSGTFVSSKGRWLWSDDPFKFSFKDGKFTVEGTAPFSVGRGEAGNLRSACADVASKFFPPSGKMPARELFTAPQWNTWIALTTNQNQRGVLKYAREVVGHGYEPGILMIDGSWQKVYGPWEFDRERFPDPKKCIDELHLLGFKVMLWISPFVTSDSYGYRAGLRQVDGVLMDAARLKEKRPAFFRWWSGCCSAMVDFSSKGGRDWYVRELRNLQEKYGVDGFKFDAGDMSLYAREKFKAATPYGSTPHGQTRLYVLTGMDFPINEYRTSWQCQNIPVLQRLHDKHHDWESLGKCIAEILAQGLLGWGFSLPDMVGGGEWRSFMDGAKPNKRLVVRSAQMQALMPSMQFSLLPWSIMDEEKDAELLDAIKKATEIRKKNLDRIMALLENCAKTGEPVCRHMEWQFPGQGFEQIRDQWALGDDMIVAPVITENDMRSVALPAGRWVDDTGAEHEGGKTIVLKDVPISRLPVFRRR